jgi:antitoxin (DNA-binding transcriptional repressor) of toxin-antitoxin stability system
MTTLTPTQARVNLSSLLRKALNGDDIGIVVRGKIVALRPVKVASEDYAKSEYGINRSEMRRIARKLHAEAEKFRQTGKSKTFQGDIEAVLAD